MNAGTLPTPFAVLTVSLLPPSTEIVPPKPNPVERRSLPVAQPAPLATATDSPAPSPVTVPSTPTLAAPPAPAAPAPVAVMVQPRFDADYLDNPKPVYPAISRRLGEQGRVVLRVHVTVDGTASEIQLHTPSGSPRLDQSALDTVRRWKFVPAKIGKDPLAAWVLVPIAFTLKD